MRVVGACLDHFRMMEIRLVGKGSRDHIQLVHIEGQETDLSESLVVEQRYCRGLRLLVNGFEEPI